MRKRLSFFVAITFLVVLVACGKEVSIDGSIDRIDLIVGQTYTIDLTTIDEKGLSYEVLDDTILSISNDTITALTEGQTSVVIVSVADKDVFVEIDVYVTALSINVDQTSVLLKAGENDQVIGTINHDLGVSYSSTDELIFTVDDEGHISAIKEGEANLIVSSVFDDQVRVLVPVTVRKIVTIQANIENIELFVGDTVSSEFTSEESLSYESSLETVATIDSQGNITAIAPGVTTITAKSTYDQSVEKEIVVQVGAIPTVLTLTGPTQVILGTTAELSVSADPESSLMHVIYESNDTSILTVTSDGTFQAVGEGMATITVKSLGDETVTSTVEIEVLKQIVIDASKTENDTLEENGLIYEYGVNLFSDIHDALLTATDGTYIIVKKGTYSNEFVISQSSIIIRAQADTVLTKSVVIEGNNVIFEGFTFEDASITINNVSNFTLLNNVFKDTDYPVSMVGVSGITTVKNNEISDAITALKIENDSVLATDELIIVWNVISNVTNGFDLNLLGEDALGYARFNKVTFSEKGAIVLGNQVDLTFNYWGNSQIDYEDFSGVQEKYLLKNYETTEDVLTEAAYDPTAPLAVLISNPVEEVWLGDPYDFDYLALPYEFVSNRYSFITSEPDVATVSSSGSVIGIKSGIVSITIRYLLDKSIKTTLDIVITTDPGIEITPSHKMSNLQVGELLSLTADVFPFTLANEDVMFESDNVGVALISQDGVVTSLGQGIVTFKAYLVSNPDIQTTYTVEFYDTLNGDNIMDLLTMNAVSYSTMRSWVAVGVGYSYKDTKYDSVNRYYFTDFTVNTSKIVPVFYAIRPGGLRPELPIGITAYNDENIHWIVIHDTAGTTSNSGALAHANYLWNLTAQKTEAWVSWHYTIDDSEIYQHVPDNEYAFHAGDGSILPYLVENRPLTPDGNPKFGGGNRNGIGIETSVADTDDVMEVWHRTAKFSSYLLDKYNLPTSQISYHHDFSGKNCPQTMRNADLVWLFEDMIDIEYTIAHDFSDWTVSMESHDPEYIDSMGRVIQHPDRAMTVSYTITATNGIDTETRTFNVYLPGTQR